MPEIPEEIRDYTGNSPEMTASLDEVLARAVLDDDPAGTFPCYCGASYPTRARADLCHAFHQM
jgi:hypothetical protein